PGRLAAGRVRAVRPGGDQGGQVVPGDVAAGGRGDPRGAGPGGGRLGGLLLHRPGRGRGGGAGGGGRARRARADEQGRQGVGRRPAAGAQPGQQRGLLQPEPVVVQPGRGVGVAQGGGGTGGP